ncbi:transmembrane 4 L6 family member 19 [Microcaecilia unicolor]|uniref:Transmembrane 4 L6 family member 19 n=1 Tax=Microcaecilia unicolor TaxID=1415580 RepID=A0A6P7Z7W6_9AMPH|nr:transmembrane 4 L6 family member 19 [Microcaecilia unicolor]
MCIGRCSRFVGLVLFFLALVSIAANAFLLFPSLTVTYLWRGLITRQALQLPGLWGGGIMVLLAAVQILAAGFKINWIGCCGSCWHVRSRVITKFKDVHIKEPFGLCNLPALPNTDAGNSLTENVNTGKQAGKHTDIGSVETNEQQVLGLQTQVSLVSSLIEAPGFQPQVVDSAAQPGSGNPRHRREDEINSGSVKTVSSLTRDLLVQGEQSSPQSVSAVSLTEDIAGGSAAQAEGAHSQGSIVKVKDCSELMFLSGLLSVMALFGSILCFAISAGGLLNGPFCLYNVLLPNQTEIQLWDYPFAGFDNIAFNNSVQNYLEDRSLWDSVCIEPSRVVVWNIHFFSVLLVINALETFLSLIQIINVFFGCLCGLCDEKSVSSS